MNLLPNLPDGRNCKSELLKILEFPKDITWEEASEQITHYIVCARKLGRDGVAARLSEARVFLKKRLKHKCASCPALVLPNSFTCRPCQNLLRRGARKGYRTYQGHYGITPVVEQFVRARQTPFFLDEVGFAVHEKLPSVPRHIVMKSAYAALKRLRKRGFIAAGGLDQWRRYEKLSTPAVQA